MIQILWKRHYVAGLTGSYHGDMAAAYVRMFADPDCDRTARHKMEVAVRIHMSMERKPSHTGRKYFCENWGIEKETVTV